MRCLMILFARYLLVERLHTAELRGRKKLSWLGILFPFITELRSYI